ncbi:TPA: hypothetical protein QCR58_005066 [Bacillus cereus]|uniref:hypothetical protein n=1 Tax=Bacillus cereus TaxID=1396 RepID=UPI000BF4FA07|nr:hypothetical protein [Bacillus cereus]PFQ62888.1 hypothetical protein COK18_18410 [Bacillus cereus]HDR4845318.1 hypothetical protein [Bacillus cereus]HDR4891593.1 hypothetical protein [Bacillus cereus]
MEIKKRIMNSKLVQNRMKKELDDSVRENNWEKVINILSKNDKLAEKYLSVLVESEILPLIASNYIEFVGKIIEVSGNSSDHVFQLLKESSAGLQKYLDNNAKELTAEERMYIGNQILEINKMAIKLDTDNKSFLLKLVGAIGTPLALIAAAVLVGVANKNELELTSNEMLDENTND